MGSRAVQFSPYAKQRLARSTRLPLSSNRKVRRGDYLATRSAKVRRQQLGRARMDKKGMDTSLSANTIISTTNTNAYISVLNLIQPGTGSWNRIGKKTHLKSVRCTGKIQFNITPTFATGACNDTFVRLIIVWDKQPSGAAIPTFDTIFGITDQTGAESCPLITCPPRFDNFDRFRILRDTNICCDEVSVPSFGSGPLLVEQVPFDVYVKLPGLESVYSGQTNPMTIADISTGALYCIFRSNTSQVNCTADVSASARVRYTD